MPKQLDKNKKFGTYMVTFNDGQQVIFGNNYKPWWQHATEFIYRKFGSKTEGWRFDDVMPVVTGVRFSNQQFYDDGGLKWCGTKAYQEVIDEVSQKDGLVPIKFEDIVFTESPADLAELIKQLKKY